MKKTVLIKDLSDFTIASLLHAGMSENSAKITADVLVTTDTFGVLSHGTKNLLNYIRKMQAGGLDPKSVPTIETEGPAWAILNGNAAIGMASSYKAMQIAIEKAKTEGIGYVGVKNSCHFGAAGYYANMAAQQGMIGIAMSNSDPNMSIPNSSGVVIGNNPFSYAAPAKGGKTVFLDIALSNVAALKVVMAKEKGQQVPTEWLIDRQGRPTTDPSGFPSESFLRPMARHKGYGLAIMVEILSAVLTGSGMLGQIASWNLDLQSKNNAGHAFIAIDIRQMLPMEQFIERMEQMETELKKAPLAVGTDRILLPGEMEWEKRTTAIKTGCLELTEAIVENMNELADMTHNHPAWLTN